MKKKTTLTGFVMGVLMLLAGVQGAFAACMGTLHAKLPETWTDLKIYYGNQENVTTATKNAETGYYDVDLSTLSGNDAATFILYTTNATYSNIDYPGVWGISGTVYDGVISGRPTAADIACPGAGAEIYVSSDPSTGGTYIGSTPYGGKFFYVLVPEEKEWQSDDVMISIDGVKDTAMIPSSDLCGWSYMIFEPDKTPSSVYMYLKNSREENQLGMNGLWGDDAAAVPVDLATLYEAYGVDTLYFIPDDAAWPDDGNSQGWYTSYPTGVEGNCSFTLAAVIYDSDQSLTNVFTSDPDASGYGACVGVHTGIVNVDLGADNKPVFSGSANAAKCFGNATLFNQMFNYTPGINEMQCYDMPFRHYGKDTRWGFDSDSTHYDAAGHYLTYDSEMKGYVYTDDLGQKQKPAITYTGGFYPLEFSSDATVVTLNNTVQGPTPLARTKRTAEAPVGYTVADLDHYCNTPGWFGGVDCGAKNLFNNGDSPAVWDWGVREEWTGVTRNQQYCFESHATFTYNEDQEFTFRGDDDIWVFINKKLAVDNGGAHLAAPGHVVLKNLNTTYGEGFLVPGLDYSLDIFFCDRRTTMTNVIIKTNMYIKQSTGLDFTTSETATGGLSLNICYEITGGSDCASVALGQSAGESSTTTQCGDQIAEAVSYSITNRKGEVPSTCADCAALPAGGIVHGGIDLTNPKLPIVYPDKISGLAPGNYRLVIEVAGKKTHYNFRIKGNLDVVANDVTFTNTDEEAAAYKTGTTWKFESQALADTRLPLYISAPDAEGGIDLISAAGQNYTLTVSDGAVLYATKDSDTPLTSLSGTIDETGVDTLWITVPMSGLGSAATKQVTASVRSTTATFTFYAPTITFAEPLTKDSTGKVLTWNPVSSDPDTEENGEEYFHWVSSDVDLYVIAMNPITNSLCTECTFTVDMMDASTSITGGAVDGFEEGVQLIRIRSGIEYVAPNAASITVESTDNPAITTSYGNMHFYKPPAPMPQLVDIFDVKGTAVDNVELGDAYHSADKEYLDGRADSIAIYYDREIAADSLPSFICVNFDGDNGDTINPYAMGISNSYKDTLLKCSETFEGEEIKAAYERSDNKSILGFVSDSTFSAGVKTKVKAEDKIASFTQYLWKGKEVKTSFEKGITDRIAPIILSAKVMPESDGSSFDILTVVFSEPAKLDETYQMEGFSFYLNSATELSASARYRAAKSQNGPATKDTVKVRFQNSDVQNPSPHVGDYIRFRTDGMANMWSDTTDLTEGAAYRSPSDASMYWNSPTDYVSGASRLPSPWVALEGAAEVSDASINLAASDPSKRDSASIQVFLVPQNYSLDSIREAFPGTLGKYLKSDMKSLKNSSSEYDYAIADETYFQYEMDIFTNLGGFVTHKEGKINCNDETIFGEGKTCFDSNKNFYLAWNMTSDKNRLVGTGAYIVKWESFVRIGYYITKKDKDGNVTATTQKGSDKKNKLDGTEVWGVRHSKTK